MTKLELQNKIATIEKGMPIITSPAVLAIAEKNLKEAREQLAALEGASPSPAPSGGGSELEKLYEQREKLRKGLQSSNANVQKASRMALPKVEAQIVELEGASPAPAPARRMPKPTAEIPEVPATKPMPTPAMRGRKPKADAPMPMPTPAKRGRKPSPPAPMPIPTPAMRGRKPKADAPMPMPTPAKRGRKPKAEAPMPMPTPAKRGRKPKAEAPVEIKGKIKRGRKPKVQAPAEIPAKAPARRGRPSLPKGAKSQEVSLNSLTKFANSIVAFCVENGIADPNLDDVRAILNILDKGKALKFEKGGKISRSGKYISKWQIKQILIDGGMKIGSDELLSGVWLKKKVDGIAEMRRGGGIGYFVIDDNILESGKSVMLGTRRISAKNRKFQGVFEGKMVGGLMKVYDYDDEMWKVVNPDEWQQAYAEGGGVGLKREKEKLTNLAYQLQNADEGWIRNNHSKFVQMLNDYKNQFKKVYGHSNYENPNNFAEGGGVGSSTITDLADFDPETTLVFDGDADFADYPEITDLGNLQKITGDAYFDESEVQDLGNLQIIGNVAIFKKSKVKDLGNLQRIGSRSYFGKRIDLQKQWGKRASEDELEEIVLEDEYAEGGGVGDVFSLSKTIMENGRFIEMVIAENVSVADFKRLFTEKGYIKRQDKSLVGFYFVKPNGDTIQLIPSFHKKGEIIRYAEGGGVGNFPPKGELKNKENLLLKYEKIGSDYEFFVYKPEKKDVSSYEQIKYVCVNKDCPTRMSYNQFLNYLYAETYLDDRKYANGGGVGVKKYEIRDYNDIYEGRYDEQGLIDWAKEYAQSRKEIIYINSVEDAKMYIESPDKNGNQNFEIYEYANGGGVEIPKNKSLRHFILNEMSDGMIANRTPFSDYATIDKIRIQAVQILNRDGDREYSMQSVSDLIQEALLEYEENKNYAEGGGVGNFAVGQSVTIAENNDNENYDDFRGKELVIYHKATNEKEHRGFDNSMEGQALYSFFLRETGEQVPFSCYDYELEQY